MSVYGRHEDPNAPLYLKVERAPPVIPSRDPLLEALGPMGEVVCTIDFETFYSKDYNLDALTTEAYVRDPRFEVLGVGVKWGRVPTVWLEEWEFRAWAERVDWSRVIVCAHHTQFDGLILSHHYGIKPGFLMCTMSMARVLHGVNGVGLDTLGPKYGVGVKGDQLITVKGFRRAQLTQARWRAFGDYCINDVDLTYGIVRPMTRELPKPELWLIDTTIRCFTEPIFVGDREVLSKTLAEEKRRKSELFTRIASMFGIVPQARGPRSKLPPVTTEEAAKKILGSGEKLATLFRAMGIEPPKKPNDKGELIYAFAKDDAGMQGLLEHVREDVRELAEARLEVKSTLVEARTERIIGANGRGAIPFYLKHAGAHTHRWSGGDGLNPQNFNRGGALRDAILAPEGWRIVVADSGQIEARVLPWLAGDKELLETFRRNDQKTREYKAEFASRAAALGHDPSKAEAKAIDATLESEGITEGDFYSDEGAKFFLKPISKKKTPLERQVSKNMLLGLGFQMSWAKFATELLKGMLGSPPVRFTEKEAEQFRVDVTAFEQRKIGFSNQLCGQRCEEMRAFGIRLTAREFLVHCSVADHLVRRYREKNKKISGLWKTMDVALRVMADDEREYPSEVRMTVGPLQILRHAIRKPNGLTLHYPGLHRSKDGKYSYRGSAKGGHEIVHVYGGLLTENAVQSLARDIVGEQFLWVRAKFATPERRSPLGTTTHDEGVCVVPESVTPACFEYMIERMRIPPAWCADLPLDASGGFGTCYGSVK